MLDKKKNTTFFSLPTSIIWKLMKNLNCRVSFICIFYKSVIQTHGCRPTETSWPLYRQTITLCCLLSFKPACHSLATHSGVSRTRPRRAMCVYLCACSLWLAVSHNSTGYRWVVKLRKTISEVWLSFHWAVSESDFVCWENTSVLFQCDNGVSMCLCVYVS